MNLHLHIWNTRVDENNPIVERDLQPAYDYVDGDFPYIQYGFGRNGEWFEIRVPVPPGFAPPTE